MDLSFLPLSVDDVDSLIEWLASDTWPHHADQQPDHERVQEWITKGFFVGKHDKTFWILLDQRKIGLIHLYCEEDGEPMLDVRINTPHRGKGIGKEAVKWVANYVFTNNPGFLRFQAITRQDNWAMRRVLEQCGWAKEGHHRMAWPVGDSTCLDKVRYAILREDWAENKVTPVRWDDEAHYAAAEKRDRESRKEQIARLFEEIISVETMSRLTDTPLECPRLTQRVIDFILIKVRDCPLEDLLKTLETVVDTAIESGALVEGIMSSLVLITYGALDGCPPSEEKRKRLVSGLMERHNKSIAIVEGRQETWAGNYGSPVRMTFGSIIRGSGDLLKELGALKYGESKEMSKSTT